MRIVIVFVGVLMLFNSGCNTIRTTFLKQNAYGQLIKQPHHFKKGLPVMLEVPTHVDVRIVQSDLWRITKDKDGNETGLEHIPEATSRSTQIDSVFTEQLFLLDPKRPAEGTGQFKFAFSL